MKKLLISTLTAALIILIVSGALASDPVKLFVNGKEIKPDVGPRLIDGRVLVPVRWVAEALGADVEWDQGSKSVIISTKPETSGTPLLNHGTQSEAESAVGFSLWLPSYLPDGTVAEPRVSWDKNTIFKAYSTGQLSFLISQRQAAPDDFSREMQAALNDSNCKAVEINGHPGWLMEVLPEAGDTTSKGRTQLRWCQNGYIFTVSGDGPLKEELVKVSSSLAPRG